jgi:hypothetical protein
VQKEQTNRVTIKHAQRNAEAFAKARTKEFLKAFLVDTGLFALSYETYVRQAQKENIRNEDQYLELLCDDYNMDMGKLLALSYALAYVDGAQGKTVKELHLAPMNIVQAPKMAAPPTPQLIDKDGNALK